VLSAPRNDAFNASIPFGSVMLPNLLQLQDCNRALHFRAQRRKW
jgi:hypothetical protein